MADIGGRVDAVQDHVGDAQHVRQGFFLHAMNGGLQGFFILFRFPVIIALVVNGAGEKATGAASGVADA